MNKETIASLLGAIITLATLAGPALATLSELPAPFCEGGECNFLIVVGADAKPADVVGAINIAARFAAEKYEEVPITAAATYNGKVEEGTESELETSFFNKEIKSWQFTKLRDTEISYEGDTYRIVETIHTPVRADDKADIKVKLQDEEGNDIDGYYYLEIPAGLSYTEGLYYKLTFKEDVDLRQTLDSTFDIDILGTRFQIINVTDTASFDALVGKVVWLAIGDKADFEDGWSVEVVSVGENNKAEVAVYKNGELKGTYVLGENEERSVSGFKVRVLSIYLQKYPEETGKVKLVAGTETRKTFTQGDEFPGNKEWTMYPSFANPGKITAGDSITIYYDPDNDVELKAGEAVEIPGDYGMLKFYGPTDTEYVDVEIKPVSKIRPYTDNTFSTQISDSLAALQIAPSKDYVLTYNNEDYKNLWILANDTHRFIVAYDDTEGKYYVIDTLGTTTNTTEITVTVGDHTYSLYYDSGLSAGATEKLVLDVESSYTPNDNEVVMNFAYSSTDDRFILGSTRAEAEASDVQLGVTTQTDIGTFEKNYLVEVSGIIVKNVKGNADNDKVMLSLPGWEGAPEFKVLLGEETAPGAAETVKKASPITMPIANLDTEIDDLSTVGKHVILVGGPAVNRWTAAVMGYDYPTYGPDIKEISEGEGFIGLYTGVEGVLAGDQTAMVVFGWEAKDTRVACAAVQQFATVLADKDVDKVIVTGSVESPTVTAVTETTTTTAAE